MPHPCEPTLQELKEIRKQLYKEKNFTEEVNRKVKAIEVQIVRRAKEEKGAKS